jgi:hypothetical protein
MYFLLNIKSLIKEGVVDASNVLHIVPNLISASPTPQKEKRMPGLLTWILR